MKQVFKLALASASRHGIYKSVIEEVISLCYKMHLQWTLLECYRRGAKVYISWLDE